MVVLASVLAAVLLYNDIDVFTQTKHVRPGLPTFAVPSFSIHTENVTMSTLEIVQVLFLP